MADNLAPALAALELDLTKPEASSTTVSLELDELLFDRPFSKDQANSFKLYNIRDTALVFRWQYKTHGSSRYVVRPACGAIPARSYMTITVTRLQDSPGVITFHSEEQLRLLYSFLDNYDAKKTPMEIWESRTSTLYFQELTAQLGPPDIEAKIGNQQWIEVPWVRASGQVSAHFRVTNRQISRSGAFGRVVPGTFVWHDGEERREMTVAVKMLSPPELEGNQDEKQRQTRVRKRFIRERNAWSKLVHPHIISMHCAVAAKPYIFISPWCEKGALDRNIRGRDKDVRLKWLRQTSEGLGYLHASGIIHGDLKTDNILLNETDDVLITDFGLSRIFEPEPDEMKFQRQDMSSLHTTNFRFKALELWQDDENDTTKRKPSKMSDVYAFGGTALEIASDIGPFHGVQPHLVHPRLKTGKLPQPADHKMVKGPESPFWDFLNDCWKESPGKRPEASGVVTRLREMREDDIWPPGNLKSPRTTI
ncbi:hypothetical protein FRB93_007322 [Tulasnella sp. JGI-2019a]|nr:hypothetical protein FRB93_007322 [Tulasnella sp. JGI-2019a]